MLFFVFMVGFIKNYVPLHTIKCSTYPYNKIT